MISSSCHSRLRWRARPHWLFAVTAVTACAQIDSRPIDEAEIERHVRALAHDSLGGRRAPGAGYDAATRYVAAELEAAGVRPRDSTYFDAFAHELRRLRPEGIRLLLAGQPAPFDYGEHFAAFYGSRPHGEGTLIVMTPEEMAAPDAASLIRGRVLLALLPSGRHGAQRFAALALARRAGAAALILGHTDEVAEELSGRRMRYEGSLRFSDTGDFVPQIYAGPALTRALSRAAEVGDVPVTVTVPWEVLDPGVMHNVLGVIPGADSALRHERVVVVAHLDHLGTGRPAEPGADSIHNGADDNASGVAALLEIAEYLAREPPRRSVVVLFTGAEESGLLGAEHFVRESVDADSVIAVINLDMLGRNDSDEIRLVGGEYSSLGGMAADILERHTAFGLRPVVEPDTTLFRRSDQFPFAQRGIPALWLFSGFHDDYHEPSDEVERLDTEKIARVASFALALVRAVADDERRPVLSAAGRALVEPDAR